ncbi:hypothetical protein V8C44DRAFT_337815 [Trichoderma aethiopicum]
MRRARDDEGDVSRLSSDSEGWSTPEQGEKRERQEVTDDGHTETTAATGTMQCDRLGAVSLSLSPRTDPE